MARFTIFDVLFRRPQQRLSFAYWNAVPLHRLRWLLLAIFCLFGMLACLIDLIGVGQKPLFIVLVWTLFTGSMAVAFFLFLARAPRYFWILIILQVAGSRLIGWLNHFYAGGLPHPTIEQGVRTAAIACLLLSVAAFVFFIQFIQSEGRRAVRFETELSLAQGIQQTLVPTIESRTAGFEVHGVSLPSDRVGGDLVDAVTLQDSSVFAYVADVSGHGLAAGILMGMVKTAVRTQLCGLASPQAVLERLNAVLPSVKEPHTYATCAALRVSSRNHGGPCVIEYAIAGQPAILHACARSGAVSRLGDQQLPLGLLQGPPYVGHQVEALPGDVLLVVTDGVVEAADENDNEFSLDRLESLLLHNLTQPLATIAQTILSSVGAHGEQTDDQTLLLIRVVP